MSKSLTAFAVAALLLAGGGAYAFASSSSTITVCVKHAGGALYKASKCVKHDKQLNWNAQGPAGATGATGPQGQPGPQGIQGTAGTAGTDGAPAAVQVTGWSGSIGLITQTGSWVFAGPAATVTTTAADATIVASGSASLGISSGTGSGAVAICYQAASGGVLHPLDDNPGSASESIDVASPATESASEVGAPGTGTWKVGVCVINNAAQAWNHNDWSVGWAMVTAGTPTSQ